MTSSAPRPASEIPGPKQHPILGWRGNVIKVMIDPLVTLQRLRDEFGDVVTPVGGGITPESVGTVFVFGSELNRQVLTDAETFESTALMTSLHVDEGSSQRADVLRHMGTGLFALNGPDHRRMRGLVMPAFHARNVGEYHDDVVRITSRLLDRWSESQRRDISQDMSVLVLLSLGKCLFGLEMDAEARRLGLLLRQWFNAPADPAVVLFKKDLWGTPYRRFLDTTLELDEYCRDLIADRRSNPGNRDDLLSRLLRARDKSEGADLTEEELLGHVVIFLLAGQPTMANCLTWTLFLLAQHGAVMQELAAELKTVLGDRPPTPDVLPELKFLDCVIKESLRIMPPVPMMGRHVTRPVELGGYMLQPGTVVVCSNYHTHLDPAIYDQPKKFNPWRWQSISPSLHEYMPFGAGVHGCIGASLAGLLTRIVVPMVLQRFRLECVPNSKIDPAVGLAISPRRGLPMLVRHKDVPLTAARISGKIHHCIDLPLS